MRSVRIAGIGGPEVVQVDEVRAPRAPRRDELLVRVQASSINGTDLGIRRGALPLITRLRPRFPLGFDLAGVVETCGPGVTGFEPGDRVAALIGHGGGAQSDRVLVQQGRAARVPDRVSSTDAAAVTLAGLTALQGLRRAQLQRSVSAARPRVLVLGASGGIGAFAVQLAKRAGATVAAATTSRTSDFVRSLGADEVIDRQQEDPLRPGGDWDLIFDTPGRVRLQDAAAALGSGGVLVSTRGISPDAVRARVRRDGRRFASVRTASRPIDLAYLLHLVDIGALRVPVDRVFPIARAGEAHRVAEDGVEGKVVIELRPEELSPSPR